MRIDFKPKSQEEVFSILLFYWAYFWRVLLLGVIMLIPILGILISIPTVGYFVIYASSASTLIFGLFIVLIVFLEFLLIISIALYLFRKLASRQFKTFSVRWIMPYPKSIFEKNYLKNVLAYLGVSFLGSFIFGAFYAFSFIFQAFLFYVFAKNEWLPFLIESKTKDVDPSLEVH